MEKSLLDRGGEKIPLRLTDNDVGCCAPVRPHRDVVTCAPVEKKPPVTTLRLTGLPLQGRTYDTQGADSRQCFLSSLQPNGVVEQALPYYPF